MAQATLSDVPGSPHELEDYVAALFQCAGYFVEKNIIERDPADILELDVVATSYKEVLPTSILAEAKSGGWGFADIFKLLGWMTYLNISNGGFFVSKDSPGKDPTFVHQKVAPFNIAFVHFGDFSDAPNKFAAAGFPHVDDMLSLRVWRYAYWIERRLVERLKTAARTDPRLVGPNAALTYHRLINDEIFFTSDVRNRLAALYDAYKLHPKLSLGVAREMDGKPYDPEAIDPTNELIRKAMYEGGYDVLQSCFYIEHRARLAILKATIDYLCLEQAGRLPKPLAERIDFTKLFFSLLPGTFHQGLDSLKNDPSFRKYAYFWQVFMWGFGGFYLEDRKEQEFKWLSEQTEIPEAEIPRALEVFDLLFPIDGSWLIQAGWTECRIIKMFPMPFYGLGAFHRLRRYGLDEYRKFGYNDYTLKDLVRWNNTAVALLTTP